MIGMIGMVVVVVVARIGLETYFDDVRGVGEGNADGGCDHRRGNLASDGRVLVAARHEVAHVVVQA